MITHVFKYGKHFCMYIPEDPENWRPHSRWLMRPSSKLELLVVGGIVLDEYLRDWTGVKNRLIPIITGERIVL